ncbi:urease accessory protein UreH [Desmospora profundinema]|uniref:Sulfite exporter TauE/SafE n=1 Tax=Desmospora profundinema TaxID=1571184 RepID=A0ABU1IH80_9BACL|nr:urease accessory protein UreH [Desmospora profundinema]MDR6224135.1 sulfite exporter TauE/SafE [Desmospora profundinema]
MGLELVTTLGFGLLLGLRHSMDPDHFIAVSTIASRTGNVLKATASGVYWGMGHTATLLLVGIPLLLMKTSMPDFLQILMELIVGCMLVILGWTSFQAFRQGTVRKDSTSGGKSGQNQVRSRSFLVGMVHGMAGSGALAVMVMASLRSFTEALLYLLLFGVGTIAGMSLFAVLIGVPFTYAGKRSVMLERGMGMTAGAVSILFGIYYLQDILFNEVF